MIEKANEMVRINFENYEGFSNPKLTVELKLVIKIHFQIKKEKADRLKMYDDLADELKTIAKAINEANLRLQK